MSCFLKCISVLLASAFILFACEQKENPSQGFVEFGYASSELKTVTADTPAIKPVTVPPVNIIYAALVTITDAAGNVIINKQEIPLYNITGQYVSKQLSLSAGKFKLTEFLIIDNARKVIYATPKAGSVKAALIKLPLPIEFEILTNNKARIIPEVVFVDNAVSATDLGYITFGFTVVKPQDSVCLNITVIDGLAKCKCLVEIPARIQIFSQDNNLVFDQKFDTATQMISFTKNTQYTFLVTSGSYPPFKKVYTYDELLPYRCHMSQRLTIPMGVLQDTGVVVPPSQGTAMFGQQFKLMQGSSVQMANDVLRIEFVSYKDSRCPINAFCVWAGEFSVTLKIYLSGVSQEIFVKGNGTATYGPYTFELIDLAPYPAEITIPEKTAVLKITKI